ncbi:hypothetical protein, partial [Mesorhizobium sp. P17.1]|uniref:hypothetical protein n=1 Tax=Mesorhizobium sp. P17.1 TaxID=3033797 RepID=UPI0023DEBA67
RWLTGTPSRHGSEESEDDSLRPPIESGLLRIVGRTEGADDKPLSSAGVTGARAVVQSAGKTAVVQLTP